MSPTIPRGGFPRRRAVRRAACFRPDRAGSHRARPEVRRAPRAFDDRPDASRSACGICWTAGPVSVSIAGLSSAHDGYERCCEHTPPRHAHRRRDRRRHRRRLDDREGRRRRSRRRRRSSGATTSATRRKQPEKVLELLVRDQAAFPDIPTRAHPHLHHRLGRRPARASRSARSSSRRSTRSRWRSRRCTPTSARVIELGGQDAKIIIFKKNEETGDKTAHHRR